MLANGQSLKVKDNHRLSAAGKQHREGCRVHVRGVVAAALGLKYLGGGRWKKN